MSDVWDISSADTPGGDMDIRTNSGVAPDIAGACVDGIDDGDMDENAGFANNILESGSTAPVPRGREAPVGCPKSRPDPAVCKSNDKSGTDDRV